VIGSRFEAPGYRVPAVRRLMMRLLARIVSRRTGVRLTDVTSGFRAISDPLLSVFAEQYPSEYLGDTVEAILLAHRHGAQIGQVGVAMSSRPLGGGTPPARAAGYLAGLLVGLLAKPRRRR